MSTFVLIHGSYQGGWIWQRIADRLHDLQHRAFAPTMEGCGERAEQLRAGITTESMAQELARFLYYQDLTDVVLVGTSSGGMVMAKTAELARDRVGRLVFADALALRDGEKVTDIVSRPASVTTDLALGPTQEDAKDRLFADLEPDLREWAAERITLHPIAVHTQPVALETFWTDSWDASVIYCRRAANPGEAHQRRCAESLDARWHELDTGHYPMLSAVEDLTHLIING
jgi:pimeloyl-ACP methyl ester carboxylesterase